VISGAWNRQEQNETLPQIAMQTSLHGHTTNKSKTKRIHKGKKERNRRRNNERTRKE
jgi:hypothetical protein